MQSLSPPINYIDLYLQQLMGAAEKTIVGDKMGKIRKQLVIDRLKQKYGNDMTGNTGIVIVKLLESIFTGSSDNLLD